MVTYVVTIVTSVPMGTMVTLVKKGTNILMVKVKGKKQPHYRPGQALRVPVG